MNTESFAMESKRSMVMEIEIKFGKGRSDRVQVHDGDNAEELAKEFVHRHKLKETSIPVITKYIESTMETFMNQPRVPRRPKEIPAGDDKESANNGPDSTETTPASLAPPPPPPSFMPPPIISRFSDGAVKDSSLRAQRNLSTDRSITPADYDCYDSDSAEADILSKISRSLSVSGDQKYSSDNSDRRISQRTFSLRDIESELAAASQFAEINSTYSVDSDNSTVAMNCPPHATLRDTPSRSQRNSLEQQSSRRSVGPGIGFGGKSHRSNSPAPGLSETLEQQLHSTADCEEYSPTYRGSGSDAFTPMAHGYGVGEGENADAYYSYRGEERDTTYSPSESAQSSSALDEPASAEEMYNRLKSATMGGHASTLNTHPNASAEYMYGAAYLNAGSGARPLKPSSHMLQLGLRKGHHPVSGSVGSGGGGAKNDSKSVVGKSTCERLHNAAQLDRNKRERRAKAAEDSAARALDESKFKLNAHSQKIVANLRPKQYTHVHVGERLYEEGVVEKELKYKRADELKDKLTPEEWSCARCGTFQKIIDTSIVIQPLHQLQNKARILNNTGETGSPEKPKPAPPRVCKKCGWNQSEVQAHQPVNIALTMSDEAESLLRGRWQGNQPSAEEGGIHQYLYENARTRENIQQLNRVLWNEANSDLTFAPVIPESSVEILQRYKTTTTGGSSDGNSLADQAPPPLQGLAASDKSILAGPALGEYFSKSATERLSTTRTRPVLAAALKSYHAGAGGGAETESRVSTLNPAHQEQFVNRLVYEYKDKRERQQKRTEYATRHDLNTGEELFKPQVGPDPAEALGTNHRTVREKGNVFENIMEKDRILKLRRKEAEDRAAEALTQQLQANQVKALDTSQQILKQSTDHNIAELFQVLLEAQDEIIQNANASPAADGMLPDWRTLLLDLDQINSDLLIPEVGMLINEVRAVKINEQHTSKKNAAPAAEEGAAEGADEGEGGVVANMLVPFASFRALVLKCMKRRDGTGRSYVYVPKKKPDVAMQMIQEKLREETFHPTIDRNSASLCMRRHKDLSDYPIEDVLQVEGERIRTKWESARQERILEASKELTFKPKLFKTPSYVKPKYWGMEEEGEDGGERDSESEERKGGEEDGGGGRDTRGGDVDDSSVVSSDEEQHVVHMPALQSRPAAPRDRTDTRPSASMTARGGPPRGGDKRTTIAHVSPSREHKHISGHGSSQHPSSSPHALSSTRQARMPVSPVLRGLEDDHSINTISTQFTADDQPPPPPRLPADSASGRSVNSAAPLVTRRNPSSSGRNSSAGPRTPAATGRASLSSSNARRAAAVASSGGGGGGNGSSSAKGLPPLPIDVAQGGSRPI